MSGGIFSIGLSGLNVAQAGLKTTSHNIANASTEGFHRQTVQQENRIPQLTGSGFLGSGVNVDTVRRQYSQFLNGQVLSAETQQSYLNAYLSQATQVDNMLADPSSGLSPALQGFFSAVQDVSANPSSVPSRQALLSQSQALMSRFQSIDGRLNEMRNGANVEIKGTVNRINELAAQIASVNSQIVTSQSTEAMPANDLLDQRDQLVSELNQLVRTSVVQQSDGSYNVFIGTGQPLVVGFQSQKVTSMTNPEDPTSLTIGYVVGNTVVPLPNETLSGGQLGGLIAFRSRTLDPAQDALGRVAMSLADTFNAQHRLGQDLNGALGLDFFKMPQAQVQARTTNAGSGVVAATITNTNQLEATDYRVTFSGGNYVVTKLSDNSQQSFATLPQTIGGVQISLTSGTPANGDSFLVQPTRYAARDLSVAINDTALVAAAAPIRTAAALTNSGNAKISAGELSNVTNVPLPSNVTLTYNQATNEFNVSGAVPGAGPFSYTAGSAISFNGISVTLTGTPADGDTFTISNNTSGVSDNRNALLLAQLQTKSTMLNGTANYQSAYSLIVSNVGNATREAKTQSAAQDALVKQSREAQQSFSGVNLDEEAANLIRYQQAYQASGKVLQIASTLFESVLALGR